MILNALLEELKGTSSSQDFVRRIDEVGAMIASRALITSADDRKKLLGLLRGRREFAALGRLCQSLIFAGHDQPQSDAYDPSVRQELVQSMIERGDLMQALDVVDQHRRNIESLGRDDHRPPTGKYAYAWGQAVGLAGRIHKQIYVDNAQHGRTAHNIDHLKYALAWYSMPFRLRPGGEGRFHAEDEWHAVNYVALLDRAVRDGVDTGDESSVERGLELQRVLLEKIKQTPADKVNAWTYASLGEAYIATGNWPAAAEAYRKYASTPGVTHFQIYGSIRQLIEVWQIDGTENEGASKAVLDALGGCFAKLIGGDDGSTNLFSLHEEFDDSGRQTWTLVITDPETHATQTLQSADLSTLQRVSESFGDAPAMSLLRATETIWSVGRVVNGDNERTEGTGFLVSGGELSPKLGDRIFFLTNSHVLSDVDESPTDSANARIVFDYAQNRLHRTVQFKVARIVWESPESQHDACLVELAPLAPWLTPLPICEPENFPQSFTNLPRSRKQCAGVGFAGTNSSRIIGDRHSLEIKDIGPKRPGDPNAPVFFHYSNQTRQGDSGGPICDPSWKVIALHRAGATEKRALMSLNGTRERVHHAEGVSMHSIRQAIHRDADQILKMLSPRPELSRSMRLETSSVGATLERHLNAADALDKASLERFLVEAAAAADPAIAQADPAPADAEAGASSETGPWIDAGSSAQRSALSSFKDTFVVAASKLARRTRNAEFESRIANHPGYRIVSDGDSWFQYPWPGVEDTIDQLSTRHNFLIHCGALAGEELKVRVAESDVAQRVADIMPDAVLLSGGGNDMLGNGTIASFLRPYDDGMSAEDVIALDILEPTIEALVNLHKAWIARVRRVNADVPIFNHGYDWAIPKRRGSWLDIPMSQNRVRDPGVQREVVRLIIDRFCARMQEMSSKLPNVHFVDCRGAVGAGSHWMDELHPLNPGFGRVAARFNTAIRKVIEPQSKAS